MMKLISWNVNGRSKKLPDQVSVLVHRNPQVIALQEVTRGNTQILQKHLADQGFSFTINSFEVACSLTDLTGPRRYGQLIASKFPISPILPGNFQVPWPERILSAEINTPWSSIDIHTTHIPPGATNFWIKIEMLEGLYQGLAGNTQRPRILCGDLNTPKEERPDGEVITWGQRINKEDKAVIRKRIRGNSGKRWDEGERNVLKGLANYDLKDVYRLVHGYERQEFSWYAKRKGLTIGRRFDHIFCSSSLNPVICEYLHEFREMGLSDHSAIEACFDISGLWRPVSY
ncbi:MAG: endonuclease/exonuclease/phosphatase family protein [Acidobacteria bacterium]|nr:endonuclease/exonuclease/phosphatase family protein [Acidobacteriota bacterium]